MFVNIDVKCYQFYETCERDLKVGTGYRSDCNKCIKKGMEPIPLSEVLSEEENYWFKNKLNIMAGKARKKYRL